MTSALKPLVCGWLESDRCSMNPRREPSTRSQLPILTWLVSSDDRHLLFDTAAPDPSTAWESGHWHYRRSQSEGLLQRLWEVAGLTPDQIDAVVMSHLHWDHAGNWLLFPSAKIYVQEREVEFASNPQPDQRHYYDTIGRSSSFPYRQLILGDGSATPIWGSSLSLVPLPGHTPGSQGLLVDDGDRRFLLAGDAVPLWENFYDGEPTPNAIATDMAQAMRTMDYIVELDAFVLPSHEPLLVALEGKDVVRPEFVTMMEDLVARERKQVERCISGK